jgi:hypothetical protein
MLIRPGSDKQLSCPVTENYELSRGGKGGGRAGGCLEQCFVEFEVSFSGSRAAVKVAQEQLSENRGEGGDGHLSVRLMPWGHMTDFRPPHHILYVSYLSIAHPRHLPATRQQLFSS